MNSPEYLDLISITEQKNKIDLDFFDNEPGFLVHSLEIIEHTAAIILHMKGMQRHAIQLCIEIHQLREIFSQFSELTWTKYCQQNFCNLGLSESSIRAAVRTGKTILRVTQGGEKKEAIHALASLSRAALFAFGDAPAEVQEELLNVLTHVVDERQGEGMTAKEINQKIQELSVDLLEKENLIKSKDLALLRISNALTAREAEAAQSREEINQLQKKISNQAQAVVHQLPPGIKDAEEMKRKIEYDISMKKDELARIDFECKKMREEQEKQERKIQHQRYAQSALDALENDINEIQKKYTNVLIEKIYTSNKNNAIKLEHLSNSLRALADTLHPSLV